MGRMIKTGTVTAMALCLSALGWSDEAAAQDPQPPAGKTAPKQVPRQAPKQQAPKVQEAPKAAQPQSPPVEEDVADSKKSLEDGPAASAQDEVPACPPGAFCEQQEVAPPEPRVRIQRKKREVLEETETAAEGTTVTLPPARGGTDPKKPRTFTYIPDPDGGPGQVIVYEDGASPPHLRGHHKSIRSVPPPPPEPERKRLLRHRRWGVNLRVDGAILPRYRGNADDVGMAGLGLSLRYRPVPAFALDLSADFMGGHDANGYERQEIPLGATALLYVNPRSLAQFYFLGGINGGFARVASDEFQRHLANGTTDDYTYFGGHGGMGLEFRVSPLIGINLDGLAFVRTRTDDDGDGRYPEFVDPETGQQSNTSVAGLVRAGVTFWW